MLRQLATPLVYILFASAVSAVFLGKVTDGMVIFAVIVVNTVVGFIQEMQAGKAIEALSRMVPINATVLRDGSPQQIAAHEIVPGDVVALSAGDKVAADMRLLESDSLHTDEAALTGESLPVAKRVVPAPEDSVVGDRSSMVFGGTLVVSGTAMAVVVATGAGTELGRISQLLGETETVDSPLTRRLRTLALWITAVILVVAVVIFGIGLLRAYPLVDSLLAAITLAVAAIPEGLPAAITIASAIGVQRMAHRHAIIRHLPAVETLGSTTVICTDKTGTLTRNQMTVQTLWTPVREYHLTGVGYAPVGELQADGQLVAGLPAEARELLLASVLCNDANLAPSNGQWGIVGDPTEAALLVAARKGGLEEEFLRDQHPRLDAILFNSERQFMATLHQAGTDAGLICVKGAPEVVLGFCDSFFDGTRLDSGHVLQVVEALASRGMRVLAMASAPAPASMTALPDSSPAAPLRFLGLAGMIDPPRPEVIGAIQACRTAGIEVKMVTGDHPSTARAIGEQLGLLRSGKASDRVVTGQVISRASQAELEELAASSAVFARVAPDHKLRLVMALQARGEVVAMTGDGVNDAPALKRADIGIAMGIGGTAVAREAADMVLADDNFASIEAAVEEGRRVYDNLIKSLAFIFPTSLGQAMIILLAVMFFPVRDGHLLMPIDPAQILWVNLVVAITLAMPLAFEAPEPDLMQRPPPDRLMRRCWTDSW